MTRATNPPREWPRVAPALYYADARGAIDWLVRVFGFEVRLVVDGPSGEVRHSQLAYGRGTRAEGVIMVAERGRMRGESPRALDGANTQSLLVFVDDVDAHCERARAGGATIASEPTTQHFGDRVYEAHDLEGHVWWFAQRVDDDAWERATAAR